MFEENIDSERLTFMVCRTWARVFQENFEAYHLWKLAVKGERKLGRHEQKSVGLLKCGCLIRKDS